MLFLEEIIIHLVITYGKIHYQNKNLNYQATLQDMLNLLHTATVYVK